MDDILVTVDGYNQFNDELNRLKELSRLSAATGSEAYNDAIGDGWHDNFEFEDSIREGRVIASKIEKMNNTKAYLKLVAYENLPDNYVNIGDTVEVMFIYSDDDSEIEKITLTGKYIPNNDLEIKEISLNSPLGRSIYKKKINDEVIYMVNNKEIKVKILHKI